MKAHKKISALFILVAVVCFIFAGCERSELKVVLGENQCFCGGFKYALEQSEKITDKEITKYQKYLPDEKTFEVGGYSFTLKKYKNQIFDNKLMRYITVYLLNATYEGGPLYNNYPKYVLQEYDGNISAGAKYNGSELVSLSLRAELPANADIKQIGEQVISQLCSVDGFEKNIDQNSESQYRVIYTSKNTVPLIEYSVRVLNNGDYMEINWYKSEDWSDAITDELKASVDIDECYSLIEKLLDESFTAENFEMLGISADSDPEFYVTDAGELGIYYRRIAVNIKDKSDCFTDVCVHTGKYVKK